MKNGELNATNKFEYKIKFKIRTLKTEIFSLTKSTGWSLTVLTIENELINFWLKKIQFFYRFLGREPFANYLNF